MKIAIVNYRYFIEGGPERYLFNITDILQSHGHEVVPFSIHNSRNLPTPYSRFFLNSIDDEVRFDKSKRSLSKTWRSFGRMFYSFEAKRMFRKFLEETRPDIIYIIHYHNKISPSILDVARSMGIPVVHRLSDFQYVCPNALLYTNGHICEECISGHSSACITQRCVLNSKVLSAIKLGAMHFHRMIHVTDKIDAFVVPSSFTISRLVKGGMPEPKMNHIPTFFNIKERDPQVEYGDYFLFLGRITPQKGLQTLVDAFAGTDMKLKIIGAAPDDGYDLELKAIADAKGSNIEFLGHMNFDQIRPYLQGCLATIVPSEWYDNLPNVILESYGFKKAVISSDCGSLTEAVIDGVTGLNFRTGDATDLRAKAEILAKDHDLARKLGEGAWTRVNTEYSPDTHYNRLMALFDSVLKN